MRARVPRIAQGMAVQRNLKPGGGWTMGVGGRARSAAAAKAGKGKARQDARARLQRRAVDITWLRPRQYDPHALTRPRARANEMWREGGAAQHGGQHLQLLLHAALLRLHLLEEFDLEPLHAVCHLSPPNTHTDPPPPNPIPQRTHARTHTTPITPLSRRPARALRQTSALQQRARAGLCTPRLQRFCAKQRERLRRTIL